jgi:competence protein CoiA
LLKTKGRNLLLVANKHNGERFSLLEIRAKESLLKVRESESFTCPGCHEPVLLRLGNKRIPHFAHLNSTTRCDISERESQYHLKGKMQLFDWLKQQHLSVELEPYLTSIHQRPDILLHNQGRKFAIEYQCSHISAQVYIKRTASYVLKGYTPIWILGASNFNRKSSLNTKISAFQWLFLQNSTNISYSPILLYYCPVEMKLIKLHNLHPFSSTDLVSNLLITPLEKLNFQQLFSEPQSETTILAELWIEKKKKWRRISAPYLFKSARKFVTELYLHNISPTYVPAEVGLPVKSLYWIETQAMIWQMYILLDSVYPVHIGEFVTFQTVYQKFQNRKAKGLVKIRSLPLIKHTHYSFAVMEYLHALEKVGVLKKVNGSTFKKVRDIVMFTNLEELEKLDEVLLNSLNHKLKGI